MSLDRMTSSYRRNNSEYENVDIDPLGSHTIPLGEFQDSYGGGSDNEGQGLLDSSVNRKLSKEYIERGRMFESDDEEKVEDSEEEEEVVDQTLPTCQLIIRIVGLGAVAIGLSICFGVEIIFSTPYIESCGVSRSLTSFYWIIGPSMTMTLQPLFGFISDRLYFPLLGRRRPWIIIGSILISFTMAVFSNSKAIGSGIYPTDPESATAVAKVFVTLSFFLLDGSLNIGNVFLKSLICDVIPQSQQMLVNAIVGGFFMMFGSIIGFILGAIPYSNFIPYTSDDIQTLYFIVIIILLFSTSVTCLMIHETKKLPFQTVNEDEKLVIVVTETETKVLLNKKDEDDFHDDDFSTTSQDDSYDNQITEELNSTNQEGSYEDLEMIETEDEDSSEGDLTLLTPEKRLSIITNKKKQSFQHKKDEEKKHQNIFKVTRKICSACLFLFKLPCNFWLCFIVQSMTYISKYIVYVYISDFVATQIFDGDPTAPDGTPEKQNFNDGVRWSNYGGVFMAVAGVLYALILPLLLKCISARFLWIIAQLLLSGSVFLGALVTDLTLNNNNASGKYLIFLSFFFFGMTQTSMNTIPWAIINVISRDTKYLRNKRGLIQTIFYGTIMFPEILVSLTGGPIIGILKSIGLPDLKGLFIIAGIISLLSIIFILLIRFPKSMKEKNKFGVYLSCQMCWWYFMKCFGRNKKKKKRRNGR